MQMQTLLRLFRRLGDVPSKFQLPCHTSAETVSHIARFQCSPLTVGCLNRYFR
jgi:hypothetical protein